MAAINRLAARLRESLRTSQHATPRDSSATPAIRATTKPPGSSRDAPSSSDTSADGATPRPAPAPSSIAAVEISRLLVVVTTRNEACNQLCGLSQHSFGTTLLAAALWFGHRFHHAVEVEAAGLLARREFAEALKPHRNVAPRRCQREHAPRGPIRVTHGVIIGALKGIHAQIGQHRPAQFLERGLPHLKPMGVLPQKGHLPIVVAQRRDAAVISPVEKLLARPRAFALERRQQVVAVEMDLEGFVAVLLAFEQ